MLKLADTQIMFRTIDDQSFHWLDHVAWLATWLSQVFTPVGY